MPGPKQRSYSSPNYSAGADNDHPFLTPKGYRIMQNRNRAVSSVPVTFPEFQYQGNPQYQYPPNGQLIQDGVPIQQYAPDGTPIQFGQPIPYGQPVVEGQAIPGQSIPGQEFGTPPFSVSPEYFVEPPIQNIKPSKKFPDPTILAHHPLTSHYKSRLVTNPIGSQLRAIGKLVIQVSPDPMSEPATGSAWIAGPSLIITSAHNLYEFSTGQWSNSIEFHPAFDYYSPKEMPTCRITSCCIPRGYMENPTTNYDIAACFVDRNIGDIVGAEIPMRPIKDADFFDTTPVTIVGYPAGSGFDFGKQMWQSKGDYLFGRSNGPGDDYSPVLATDFGGGSSGCPWLIQDKKTKKLVSVGVTSAHAKLRYDKGEPNLMSLISPYFGSRLFDSLSHDHVFHEFESEDEPRRKKKRKG